MAAEEKWYFTREQLANTPSRKCGYDADKELSCRQQAANFIQDMGQRLQVNQLCINTAIVYMHRFYMFHSFTRFHRNAMAAAALFLAAKVEEQPRKLEHVIKVSQICLHREQPPPDVKSEVYIEQAQELVVNENILLQTLGFDVAIDHPHTHVVRCCHLVRASKDLAQTSYFMASNSLHLTTMCLQYKPTLVACFCIHLACKWSNWEIPQSTEGKQWFWYVDKTVSQELLEQLTEEFLVIFEKCPSRLKKKIMSVSSNQNSTILSAFTNDGDRKRNGEGSSSNPSTSMTNMNFSGNNAEDMKKKQEYLRHHPDYKKHHVPHHATSRGESHMSKSSCMFGPPTRSIPPGGSHTSSSSASTSSGTSVLRSAPSKPALPMEPASLLGKPEHLHHRPRRPEEKHPRNHELVTSQYKKYDKVSSGVLSDFLPANVGSNNNNSSNSNSYRISVSSSNNSYLSVPLSHVQSSSNVYLQQLQQQPQTQGVVTVSAASVPSHQQGQPLEVVSSSSNSNISNSRAMVTESNVIGQSSSHMLLNKHQLQPPQSSSSQNISLSQPSITSSKVKSPTVSQPIKVERSIFSPEKNTPPSEAVRHAHPTSQSSPSSQAPPSSVHAATSLMNSNVTNISSGQSVTNISSSLIRKKGGETAESVGLSGHNIKSDEVHKPIVSSQYLPTEANKIEPICKEEKPPDILKPHEGTVSHNTDSLVVAPLVNVPISSANSSEDTHKEQKKKKKKHKEHKEKHKDKHKHKHKNREPEPIPEPIVITIPKEKLSLPQQVPEQQQGLLKIKIAKDKIATSINPAPTGLKLKIPREKIKESRKRERSEERSSGLPNKFHRANGTTLQVNKVIDIMECSDSENDKLNISLESTNSPPIALNDACPSFDEILRPGTPPGMSDVLLELFQTDVPKAGTDANSAVASEDKSSPSKGSTVPPSVPINKAEVKKVEISIASNANPTAKGISNNQNNKKKICSQQSNSSSRNVNVNNNNGNKLQNGGAISNSSFSSNRGRYSTGGGSQGSVAGGGNRRRGSGGGARGYPAQLTRIPPPPLPPPPAPYLAAAAGVATNNWPPPPPPPPPPHPLGMPPQLPSHHHHGYILAPPPTAITPHFYTSAMIVPNYPPPPPLPDDPPPQQPPPPPPE